MQIEHIVAIRRSMGMTRAQFADHLGVTRQTVTNWETDKSKPVGIALRLLRMLDNEGREHREGTGEV